MTSASELRDKVIYFDTNIFISAVEQPNLDQGLLDKITRLFSMAVNGEVKAITSELTLAEVLVGAYKTEKELVVIYDDMLTNKPELSVHPIDREILRDSSYIRTIVTIALADAIHVATAIAKEADFFITNDVKMHVPDSITKLLLSDIELD